MSGCDTLIVENGYYYDALKITASNLNGNIGGSGCYTVIEAATPWAVIVDASKVNPQPSGTIFIGGSYIQVIGIEAASNPAWTTASMPWFVDGANHIKLQQTAGFNAPCYDNTDVYAIGPGSSYVLVEDSHAWGCGRYKFMSYQSDHVIFRRDVARHDYHDVTGWTSPGPDSNITGWGRQCGDFVNYDGQYTIFQNDIAIDSGMVDKETGNLYGGLWSEHNNGTIDNPIEFEGSIIDNVQATASWADYKQAGLHTFINDASVNSEGGAMIGPEVQSSTIIGTAVTSVTLGSTYATINISPAVFVETGNTIVFSGLTGTPAVLNGPTQYRVLSGANDVTPVSTFTVNYSSASPGGPYSTGGSFLFASGVTLPTTSLMHMTIANVTGTTLGNYVDDANGAIGIGVEGTQPLSWYTSPTVSNSIFQNMTSGNANAFAISDWVAPNYNYYYDNTANFGSTVYLGYTPTAGPEDVLSTNPQIKYITREEVGSPVYGTASDGGNIGATILYEIGTTGTLYGDPGYDTITGTSLWPFPNEGTIQTDMASFSMTNPVTGNPIIGARGFAASGTGLYGGPITLTSYIWEALGNPCPAGICQ